MKLVRMLVMPMPNYRQKSPHARGEGKAVEELISSGKVHSPTRVQREK